MMIEWATDLAWFDYSLDTLERDGLVTINIKTGIVALVQA